MHDRHSKTCIGFLSTYLDSQANNQLTTQATLHVDGVLCIQNVSAKNKHSFARSDMLRTVNTRIIRSMISRVVPQKRRFSLAENLSPARQPRNWKELETARYRIWVASPYRFCQTFSDSHVLVGWRQINVLPIENIFRLRSLFFLKKKLLTSKATLKCRREKKQHVLA